MAVGWTDDDAVLDQIQDTVNDEIHRCASLRGLSGRSRQAK